MEKGKKWVVGYNLNSIEDAAGGVICRFKSYTDAYPSMGEMNLMAAAPELLAALERIALAAECRDNTAGDPSRLIEVKAELAAAAAHAHTIIKKAKGV